MAFTATSLSNCCLCDSNPFQRNRYDGKRIKTTLAGKRDLKETSKCQQQPIFQLRVANTIVARTVVAILGLGFIDAGYSGDWSRIGVISKESEDLLKATAFVVVPFCLFLIFSISPRNPES